MSNGHCALSIKGGISSLAYFVYVCFILTLGTRLLLFYFIFLIHLSIAKCHVCKTLDQPIVIFYQKTLFYQKTQTDMTDRNSN